MRDAGNVLIAGDTGKGKSFKVKNFVKKQDRHGLLRTTVIIDFLGEYDGLIRVLNGTIHKPGTTEKLETLKQNPVKNVEEPGLISLSVSELLPDSENLSITLLDAVENIEKNSNNGINVIIESASMFINSKKAVEKLTNMLKNNDTEIRLILVTNQLHRFTDNKTNKNLFNQFETTEILT